MADDPLSKDPPPTPAEIADALRDVMTRGLRATRVDDSPVLGSLHAIRRRALVPGNNESMTAALHAELRALMGGVRRDRLRRLAPYAFGTYTLDELPLATRLSHAQHSGIGWTAQTMRKQPLQDLAGDMAERLHWLECRIRWNGWLERPYDEALDDQTLRQYDFMAGQSFWLNAAALDLAAALEARASGDEYWFREWGWSALWRWTRFIRFAGRFDEEFSGVYTLVHIKDQMKELVRAGYDAEVLPPLSPSERSFLRLELLAALQEELASFRAALERSKGGRAIVEKWFAWITSCECGSRDEEESCPVHRLLREAATFFDLVGREIGERHRIDRAARFRTLPDIYEA